MSKNIVKTKKSKNTEAIKYMNITEFRELGFLQEVNRQFFHPLGMALATKVTTDKCEVLEGIWDYRDDPEGIYFEVNKMNKETFAEFERRKLTVQLEQLKKAGARKKLLGFVIEPIKRNKPDIVIEGE